MNSRKFKIAGSITCLLLILFSYQHCGKVTEKEIQGISALTAPPTSVAVESATVDLCADGGVSLKTYIDTNINGMLDEKETVVSTQNICNGAKGATGVDGSGAGILVSTAAAGACSAGGINVTTFVDTNNNGILDTNEMTTSTSSICNGVAGTNGANGADGKSAELTLTKATTAQCSNGGVVYTSTSAGADPETNIICNGADGEAGTNGNGYITGVLGPLIPKTNLSACHHDFMYFPSTSGGSTGWLTFRHQKNGSEDQGIGTTGFNVWNVDISNFALVSETGNVTYCNLTYNPKEMTLNYTVVDKTDGMAGKTGTIKLKQ